MPFFFILKFLKLFKSWKYYNIFNQSKNIIIIVDILIKIWYNYYNENIIIFLRGDKYGGKMEKYWWIWKWISDK